ncbi:MAG: ATP-grasp domain-containing protein [Planctomycetota bacterium]|jgi:D-alanine-D-alanine ligase
MKIAIVYNRQSQKVINAFGLPNREKYGKKAISRIARCLKDGGHQVASFEGDKDLIGRLEEFMPSVVAGERPGLVFNLAYGIQGQARYTHVPSILEMVGIPYVGSGPLAHSLALDKVVAKMIFQQHGIPTPDYAVLESPDGPLPEMDFPLIVKPRNESVSFGLRVVHDEDALREAATTIFQEFAQGVLVEKFIDGREINVGLLGNSPTQVFPPAELVFGDGPKVYTVEDKRRQSGREIGVECPAQLTAALSAEAQSIALRAFKSLGCFDCARVDMRVDESGQLYVLEINSLPSLGEHGSYVQGAETVGMSFGMLVNRLVEVASERYFGTSNMEFGGSGSGGARAVTFDFLTSKRDSLERRIQEWTRRSSRTADPVGVRASMGALDRSMKDLGLNRVEDSSVSSTVTTWATPGGLAGGTLLIAHLDVPLSFDASPQAFRRDPEWLYGEGVGASRSSLAIIEYTMRALRKSRALRRLRLGVLVYSDEGRDALGSSEVITETARKASRVLVLHSAGPNGSIVTQRRGLRRLKLTVRGPARKLGNRAKRPDVMRWLMQRLECCCELTNASRRIAVGIGDLRTTAYRALLPHEVQVELMIAYPDREKADSVEAAIRAVLGKEREGPKWELETVVDRPAMQDRRAKRPLLAAIDRVAADLELELPRESSLLPSVAGLVPAEVPVICGLGAATNDVYTAQESVNRLSIVQRVLLLTHLCLEFDDAKGAAFASGEVATSDGD